MRYLYSALFYLSLPLVLLRLLWRSRRAPAYRRRLRERFGFFTARPADAGPVVWVHAVSVGETLAAAPLVEALLGTGRDVQVVVTTTTPTGSEQVRALFGERVLHIYCPWDLPGAVRRFLNRLRPDVLVLMETELWPNLLHYSHARGCRILLANARLSQRSAGRYARGAGFVRQMLGQLDLAACQTPADAGRLEALGLPPGRSRVTGNLKFDIELGTKLQERARALREQLGRPVLLGASTHPGEEAILLDAFAALRERHPGLLLLLVPRHPERFQSVAALCAERGWQIARRSAAEPVSSATAVWLGDTMGELRLLCGVATVCVVGGSFIAHGGQNPLEAAAWGVPVVSGPHMFNFAEISRLLVEAGAMRCLQDAGELAPCLLQWLGDPAGCARRGAAGAAVVAANRGARSAVLGLVAGLLPGD